MRSLVPLSEGDVSEADRGSVALYEEHSLRHSWRCASFLWEGDEIGVVIRSPCLLLEEKPRGNGDHL